MTLETLLADHQLYHSEFQMDHFITGKSGGPTAYGQYKQALRELHKRSEGLKQLRTQTRLLEIDIQELEADLSCSEMNKFKVARNKVKLEEKQMQLDELLRNVADSQREFQHFSKQAVALKALVGELTQERRATLEKDMWFQTVKQRVAFDFVTQGRVSRETFDLLLACPRAWRVALLKDSNHQHSVEWLENLEPLALERGEGNALETRETKSLSATIAQLNGAGR